mmetsp:Transcript_232/g.790  ORF Transcript_232/g.790 Transcript_232/m.790 type:complete len:82 (+) Transcript_232:2125-2370(+)
MIEWTLESDPFPTSGAGIAPPGCCKDCLNCPLCVEVSSLPMTIRDAQAERCTSDYLLECSSPLSAPSFGDDSNPPLLESVR